MKIWLVIYHDRHTDDEIHGFRTQAEADAFFNSVLEDEELNDPWAWVEEQSGFDRYARTDHDDGPRMHIEVIEV